MLTRVMLPSLLFGIFLAITAQAQPSITSIAPLAIEPGKTTRVVVQGAGLVEPLRVWTSRSAQVTVARTDVPSTPTQVTIDLTPAADSSLGPVGLWLGAADGPTDALTLLLDDLPTVVDNGSNHARDQAQAVPSLCGIDGTCDGPQSDFYRIHALAGEQVSFEVFAQRVGSKMDAVVKLYDAAGKWLFTADDDANGTDNRFRYRFPAEGDYIVEVFDNRFVAGGRYRLRIGDFPIIDGTLPLVGQLGSRPAFTFLGEDNAALPAQEIQIPAEVDFESLTISTKLPNGKSSSWYSLPTGSLPQVVETARADATPIPLTIPVGLSGRLMAASERDTYLIGATKGQVIRFSSKTRSLNLPTVLQMQLFNAAGVKVAETAVNDADEWAFDYTVPEDSNYRLELTDLLHRGGPSLGYYVEIAPSPKFSVALKPDAKTRERFPVEMQSGAAALDVQIVRTGYDGPIDIGFAKPLSGLQILNPRIDAKINEARIYLKADENWKAESFAGVRLVATASETPETKVPVSSLGLQRIKQPTVPFPAAWTDGLMNIAGTAVTPSYFSLEAAAPVLFAKQQASHSATYTLKRTVEAFKEGVAVLASPQPAGWSASTKVDKDAYAFTWTRPAGGEQPEQLSVLTYSELNGRGRLQTQSLPIAWIDPLKLTLMTPREFVPGKPQRVELKLEWDSRVTATPVTLSWINLPAGVTGTPLELAANQAVATLDLTIASNVVSPVSLQLQAVTQFAGQPLTVTSQTAQVSVLPAPTKLEVFPQVAQLNGPKDARHFVVTGLDDRGGIRDWTADCTVVSSNPAVASIDGNRIVAVANGTTDVTVEVGALRQVIPVTVASADQPRRTQFENEVLVALSKQSCNSGACHGSPSGKGGFRLSLRAFDQQLDQMTLIREEFGRRINTLEPELSLLLQKPLMQVAHGGGMQLHKQDSSFEILRKWIAEGATIDPPNTARCVKLEVFPNAKRVMNRAVAPRQQLIAVAHFADGTSRDMTQLASYESSNTSVATVTPTGLVTCLSRGEAVILVRFLEHIETVPLMFVEDVAGFAWQAPPANNFIDDLVNAKLQQLQYLPAPTTEDSEFLRRVYLDVIGLLPSPEETTAFLADTRPDKRNIAIDNLLERPEHAKFWALKWGDLLRMTGKNVGDDGVYKYHRWLEQSIQDNMPYDQFAMQLLTATGSTLSNPPANFFRTATDTNDSVESISQVFLGARLQCAKCHNHPFERWTQDNYYGLGAFFQRVQRKKSQRPGEIMIWAASTGEVTQPRTGQVMKPWLPKVGTLETVNEQDRRIAFAEWLVRPDNPYFARIEANRIWSQLFTRGIVDPIDDFRDSNPPTNGPLLDALAKEFVDHKFDRKHLLRVMLQSRTYQASFVTNKFNQDDTRYFSHQEPRLLTAEQLLDAVNQTMGVQQTFGQLPPGTKATQLPAPDLVKVDFLKVFGQPERSTVCACERAEDSNLAMAIELFNGPMIYERLRDPNNRFRKSLAAGKSMDDTIRELYIAALSRQPTDAELATATEHAKSRPEPAAAVEDICWALLNTDEFLFQH